MLLKKKQLFRTHELKKQPEENFDQPIKERVAEWTVKSLPKNGRQKKGRQEKKENREKVIDKQLAEIYENSDGSLPDMTKFKKRKPHRLVRAFFTLFISLFFLGTVAWIIFFVISPQSGFSEADVVLDVTGNDTAVIGQEVRYTIKYRNTQRLSLSKTVLQIRYPEGFVFVSATPESTSNNRDEWRLGTLENGDGGEVEIVGKLYGNAGVEQSLRAFLNYFPSNFNAEFQKISSFSTKVTDPPFSLTVSALAEVQTGAKTNLTISLNKKDETIVDISALSVVVEPDSAFVKLESTPASDQFQDYRWSVPDLSEKREIVLSGAFSEPRDPAFMTVKVIGKLSKDQGGDEFIYSQTVTPVKVIKTDVMTTMVVNGGAGKVSVQPGEKVHVNINVKNNSSKPIKNVSVRTRFDLPSVNKKSIFKWSALEDENNGDVLGEQINDKVRRAILTWGAEKINSLKSIAPGEQVVIEFFVPVKSTTEEDFANYPAFSGQAIAEIRYTIDTTEELTSSPPIIIVFNSDVGLEIEDNVKVEAGKENHTISWLITNSVHELQSLELEAEVYGDISWDELGLIVPAGEATFDKKTKKIVWKIPQMPISLDVLALQFVVVLNSKNPTQTNLTSKVKFFAKDAITTETIFKLGEGILLK